MNDLFNISAAVAVISTVMVITKGNAVHALLYLIISLLAVAMVFLSLGAPFVAALEVIIYAGAIMVLFVFVIMMLNLGPGSAEHERKYLGSGSVTAWILPAILGGVLIFELLAVFVSSGGQAAGRRIVGPKETGIALFGSYLIGVELASMLLLSGLIGAYHLGHRMSELDSETGRGGEK
jgi:NADH-quinone oxidoreductase subunit J